MGTGRDSSRRGSKGRQGDTNNYKTIINIFIVSNNGKLVSNVFHEENKKVKAGQNPHIEDLTEIFVPGLNIHQRIVNNDGIKQISQIKRNVS